MKKRKIRTYAKVTAYVGAFITLVLSIALIEKTDDMTVSKEDDTYQYVNSSIVLSNNVPVVSQEGEKVVLKPYNSDKVEISKKFYEKDSSDEEKEKSLIYYNDTYMQNSGILYKSSEQFDVINILDGTVIEVKNDEILGKVVEVKHSNNVISTYEGLSEVNVKKDQTINSGTVIGKSGKLELGEQIENGLLFELIKDGKHVNPLNYYDKKLSEI